MISKFTYYTRFKYGRFLNYYLLQILIENSRKLLKYSTNAI